MKLPSIKRGHRNVSGNAPPDFSQRVAGTGLTDVPMACIRVATRGVVRAPYSDVALAVTVIVVSHWYVVGEPPPDRRSDQTSGSIPNMPVRKRGIENGVVRFAIAIVV